MISFRFFKKLLYPNINILKQKTTNIPSFSSNNKLYGCDKIKEDYEDLINTMKKHMNTIEQSFKGKGYNYLSNSLNNLINVGLKDHVIIEEIIKNIKDNQLHLQI